MRLRSGRQAVGRRTGRETVELGDQRAGEGPAPASDSGQLRRVLAELGEERPSVRGSLANFRLPAVRAGDRERRAPVEGERLAGSNWTRARVGRQTVARKPVT
jgi:hypothetical protein